MSAAILIVWTDIPAEIEADFNEWYNREHLPDRVLRMPGFLRGRRYVCITPAAGCCRLWRRRALDRGALRAAIDGRAAGAAGGRDGYLISRSAKGYL